ncbi:ATP-binding cassette domain-containing protein [Prescottella agglutinans]|uniref:Iron complex transport system ATP-binding protein n=1 Tax=Prescottella agglutinans TaxID=1644129 RepID=A0ABT6MDS0_9NOCA|nr:ATP-binding cassette domain-containing protein [Prescottella agglutinans]MDH6282059.1 iron complex transport system ATP-binding protein [Prescottella agglutinans]
MSTDAVNPGRSDVALRLDDVTTGYSLRRALRPSAARTVAGELSATARRGELTVLLGPNGSGKSTLLRTICGLQPALDGTIALDGRDIRGMAADEVARAIAVVLTERVDPGMLSGRELAGLGRTPHLGLGGRMSARDHAVVAWALDAVGANHLADRPASEMSDGERQRVLTARALAQEPTLLVLDEPTAFLDVPSRVALVELMRRAAREHDLAVVMSTHDLELALRVADHVWLLDRSGRLDTGTPEQLALDGRIGTVFDSQALRFDAASGVFVLDSAVEDKRRVRVFGPDPRVSAVCRLLGREGFGLAGTDDADAELSVDVGAATSDAGVALRHAGRTLRLPDVDALPDALRTLPDSTLHVATPAEIAATLAEIATVSPYLATTSGAPGAGLWRPVRDLYEDPGVLAETVDAVRTRIGPTEWRVAASTLFFGYAARLWKSALGGVVLTERLPDLDPDDLEWTCDNGTISLNLRDPRGWRSADPAALVDLAREMVLDRHLVPMVDAIREAEPMSARLLWGNVASAVLGAARVIGDGSDPETALRAQSFAETILRDPRLDGAVVPEGDGYRRRSCCLFYRTPTSGYCGDCVLTRPTHDEKETA